MYKKYTSGYWYKTNGIILSFDDDEHRTKLDKMAHDMIVNGLRSNLSLTEQIDLYKNQLDAVHPTIKMEGVVTTTKLSKTYTLWIINILALLKLKAIPNDEYNGTQYLDKN